MANTTEKYRDRQLIIVREENFNEATEYVFKSLLIEYGGKSSDGNITINGEDVTLAVVREKLRYYLTNWEQVDPRKNFGRCKCTHPPGGGICLLGACIFGSIGKGGGSINITINI